MPVLDDLYGYATGSLTDVSGSSRVEVEVRPEFLFRCSVGCVAWGDTLLERGWTEIAGEGGLCEYLLQLAADALN